MPKRLIFILTILVILALPASALAQTYSFSLNQLTVNVFLHTDGTMSIDYVFVFANDPSASPIDYVDVGLPNSNFDTDSISADVNGFTILDISSSGFQGSGSGVALGLGSRAIKPGQTGTVHVFIGTIRRILYPDREDKNYVGMEFSPTWFGSQYVYGSTFTSVTIHLPPGVKPEEPRWHAAPSGFPNEPVATIDDQGQVAYTWSNASANGYTQYKFGVSFPKAYIPASAIVSPPIWEMLGIDSETFFSCLCCSGFIGLIVVIIYGSYVSSTKRKLQYLPPRISIEGHGIKRGLTAVEAALLLEQPLDKILTMILFGVLKKNAAMVETRDPLQLKITDPLPAELQPYEIQFLDAFQKSTTLDRRRGLQDMMVELVKSVTAKMKGFSRKETVAYYRDITKKAWEQVEAANTPEVKSQKYDEVMEWTMLDKDYGERTRDIFHSGPVFIPRWWSNYDPDFRRSVTSSAPSTAPASSPGGGISLPNLPGATFAASIVRGTQDFAAGVIGNVSDFTGSITQKTNPEPVSTSSGRSRGGGGGGGGGHSCACACACASCACACAGGGR